MAVVLPEENFGSLKEYVCMCANLHVRNTAWLLPSIPVETVVGQSKDYGVLNGIDLVLSLLWHLLIMSLAPWSLFVACRGDNTCLLG